MSADNGIYIIKAGPNDFRVTHAMAIDNVDYFEEGTPEWQEQVLNYFGEAPRFSSLEEARNFAYREEEQIEENGWFTEYGVRYLGDYSAAFE